MVQSIINKRRHLMLKRNIVASFNREITLRRRASERE
jgi:hypothetical protein